MQRNGIHVVDVQKMYQGRLTPSPEEHAETKKGYTMKKRQTRRLMVIATYKQACDFSGAAAILPFLVICRVECGNGSVSYCDGFPISYSVGGWI